jgi:hypothetical protein
LIVTPQAVAATWDMLRSVPPISRWNLPPADEVEFRTPQRADVHGEWTRIIDGHHIVTISSRTNGHLITLIQTVAHEMIHAHQDIKGTSTRAQHNAQFRRLAAQVCRHLGFDEKAF